ncbi:MAG TPA: hypothetical protein VEJ16_05745 [Alphaproteobacteria bacterium]|nr:hypothetical protein [Alphaproteobacteria bacterium]
MPKLTRVPWRGGTGRAFDFFAFPLPCVLRPNLFGVYIFARREGQDWQAIFIGQHKNLRAAVDDGQRDPCILQKGSSHVFVRDKEASEQDRIALVRDLLAGHPEALAPHGCTPSDGK